MSRSPKWNLGNPKAGNGKSTAGCMYVGKGDGIRNNLFNFYILPPWVKSFCALGIELQNVCRIVGLPFQNLISFGKNKSIGLFNKFI